MKSNSFILYIFSIARARFLILFARGYLGGLMINPRMQELGSKRSVIRELFEYGKKQRALLGEEAVFDFSLGNPSVPAPADVGDELTRLLQDEDPVALHGYTSAEGDLGVRTKIAEYISGTYGVPASAEAIYMTVGAAAALTISLNAILTEGEEVIAIAPYFPEYKVFVEGAGGKLVSVPARDDSFYPDIEKIRDAINERTAAVIINSPNNPTGVVYDEGAMRGLSNVLREKSAELGKTIYLISDEPYRELVYDSADVPYLTKFYDNTLVCYSFSKSLSIPGERIGYAMVSPTAENAESVFKAIAGAGRSLGYVCAPSIFQKLVPYCLGKSSELSVYEENRKLLYDALTEYGYEVVYPSGAFYLFVKTLIPNAKDFSDIAKKYGLLLVPSDDFGCEGYVRLAYCQNPDMIRRSLPAFEQLIREFK
jgi:aspartate aminotransferase